MESAFEGRERRRARRTDAAGPRGEAGEEGSYGIADVCMAEVVFSMFWIFLGLMFIGAVLWYWLRKISRGVTAGGAVIEAALNRAATNRGEPPVSDDVDTKAIF